MDFFQALILGTLQGLTEFLPVSSSGHLVIAQKLFGFQQPPVLFDILVHLGTLIAILIYLRKQIKNQVVKNFKKGWQLIVIGTIPAGLVGLFLNHYLEKVFNSIFNVAICLLITAFFLFSTKLIKKTNKNFSQLTQKDAWIIGVFQALAILPGISRSGSTVVAGLWQGLKKETAFSFSFFLAIPAILGALVLQLPKLSLTVSELKVDFLGMVSAAVFGLASLKVFEKAVLKGRLFYFGFYCLLLGIIILLFSFSGL